MNGSRRAERVLLHEFGDRTTQVGRELGYVGRLETQRFRARQACLGERLAEYAGCDQPGSRGSGAICGGSARQLSEHRLR